MKKISHWVISAACLSASVGAGAQEQVINFYNWADYIDPATIAAFEEETGIRVNYDVFDANEVLEAKMLTGGSGYDLVVPAAAFLERQVVAGVYQKIDKSQLSNLGNIDAGISTKIESHDPGNQYSVPYTWGTIGLGYNVTMLKERLGDVPVNSWDIIFKPELAAKLADCGINMLDSPAEIISVALNYLGKDPNSEDRADLAVAAELVASIRPHIATFTSSEYRSNLASGDACLAVGYNGDILMAQADTLDTESGIEVAYSIPVEGTLIWFDLMAIPADAPNPQAAHQFIDFVLRPESGAALSNFAYFAVPNNKAEPMLLEEIKTDPSIYPPAVIKDKLFPQKAHSAKFDRRLTRAWTNIKTGR